MLYGIYHNQYYGTSGIVLEQLRGSITAYHHRNLSNLPPPMVDAVGLNHHYTIYKLWAIDGVLLITRFDQKYYDNKNGFITKLKIGTKYLQNI